MDNHWKYSDGGRAETGFKGDTGDCVTRSIAIASGKPYREVYNAINGMAVAGRAPDKGSTARLGVPKNLTRRAMEWAGAEWTPTMAIGSGCQVHLRAEELPPGRLAVSVSRHITAVLDGVIYDTHDPSRDGTRCVYGYWRFPE